MGVVEKVRIALSDRYDIQRQIGAGGMATVHLARDLRHQRLVALKLLSPELGAVLGTERFLSEIRVTANLQHPNLLPLFDSGDADGQLYYVMPYVEGESLRARIEREKQLPVNEAVRIAAAAASALDHAHRHGVIHRDLKPENILLQEGQPLVADFGIALAVSNAGGERVTQSGLSLGTPQYMSPEQAAGDRSVDGRTDIYSLGAVLYEMLIGEPPHTGATVQAIIARVLTDKPRSVRSSRPAVPEHVDFAVRKALEKVPADRFDTAREFAEVLQGTRPVTIYNAEAATAPERGRYGFSLASRRTGWIVAGIALASALFGFAMMVKERSARRALENSPPVTFTVEAPPDGALPPASGALLAISPDGRFVAHVLQNNAASQIYVRGMGDLVARPLRGTERGFHPFFSPDGRSIGFFANGELRKISRDGGPVIALAQGLREFFASATWTRDNRIIIPRNVFSVGSLGLSQIPAGGGTPKPLTLSDSANGKRHVYPVVLADNKTLLFSNQGRGAFEDDYLAIGSADGGHFTVLDILASKPLGYTDGHAVFWRSDGKILAVPLDIGRRALTGDAIAIMEGVAVGNGSAVSLSLNGTLAFASGNSAVRLVWAEEKAQPRNVLEEPGSYWWPRISPDGTQIAVTIIGSALNDVWIYNIRTGTRTRLTTEGGERPEWTPDGKRVLFTNRSPAGAGIWWQPVDGSGPAERLDPRIPGNPTPPLEAVISPDGKTVLVRIISGENHRDLYYMTIGPNTPAKPWLATKANEITPRFSPDGKWVAYASDESRDYEVYVRPFPGPGARYQISTGGGSEPVWSRDGRRIYYMKDGQMMVADVAASNGFAVLSRRVLFPWRAGPNLSHANYDVSPDGKMLMLQSSGEETKMVVITNWFTELRAKLAQAR